MSKIFEKGDELDHALLIARNYANKFSDGHFTLMKFTTNWRCCFRTINLREEIENMPSGKKASDAIFNAIVSHEKTSTKPKPKRPRARSVQ